MHPLWLHPSEKHVLAEISLTLYLMQTTTPCFVCRQMTVTLHCDVIQEPLIHHSAQLVFRAGLNRWSTQLLAVAFQQGSI